MSSARPMAECAPPRDVSELDAIRAAGKPVVMRGLVSDWPAVKAAGDGDEAIVRYILESGVARPVRAIAAAPTEGGRFFYNAQMTGFNFMQGQGRLDAFLADLLTEREKARPHAMAVQAEAIGELLPGFHRENRLPLLPGVDPHIWIGNRIRVAPHFDIKENIACCVAGRRRFTLFPPGQTANLYPGPLELTPAGTPVSMVDLADPDLTAHPRFAEAWSHAEEATLEPGDAIYIPYCWWHGVESLEAVSILANYWWNDGQAQGNGSPYDALLHAIMAYRHLPQDQRKVWRGMLDYYVFEESGDPAAHLPEHAKGVLGPPGPDLFARIRSIIRSALG
ncbi:cupin-like domain-containing protein [Aurantiacibacter poecillastricola]|uniref:cupin-like domain-containing protein n=1 Tax=Aurantiacibacter poecillastricola TaxID=3064385 RepID=UPI00273F0DBD|nr:cupin-like domain-containing protein [Aurantiacibacter sp. 219JJ12-13]MDP5260261.1 cupin-like domain-containing protein [Aurantiacibacter sp. 219JJ12-13]